MALPYLKTNNMARSTAFFLWGAVFSHGSHCEFGGSSFFPIHGWEISKPVSEKIKESQSFDIITSPISSRHPNLLPKPILCFFFSKKPLILVTISSRNSWQLWSHPVRFKLFITSGITVSDYRRKYATTYKTKRQKKKWKYLKYYLFLGRYFVTIVNNWSKIALCTLNKLPSTHDKVSFCVIKQDGMPKPVRENVQTSGWGDFLFLITAESLLQEKSTYTCSDSWMVLFKHAMETFTWNDSISIDIRHVSGV